MTASFNVFDLSNLCANSVASGAANCKELSVRILSQVFGQPIDVLVTPGSPAEPPAQLLPRMLGHFNVALLGTFLVIYAAMLIIGTLNTAHEGQFLGRQWNSVWVPVRAILGPLFVAPIKGGFCAAQYMLMYVILVGVSMATYVWSQSVADVEVGYVPTVPASLTRSINHQIALAFLYGSIDTILMGHPNHYQGSIDAAAKYLYNGGSPDHGGHDWEYAYLVTQQFINGDNYQNTLCFDDDSQLASLCMSAFHNARIDQQPGSGGGSKPSELSGWGKGLSPIIPYNDPLHQYQNATVQYAIDIGTNVTSDGKSGKDAPIYPNGQKGSPGAPNDLVNVSAGYKYNLNITVKDPGASITPDSLEDWLGSNGGNIPGTSESVSPLNIFSNYVGNGGVPVNNHLCTSNSSGCSFSAITTALLTALIETSAQNTYVCGDTPGSKIAKGSASSYHLAESCIPGTGPNPSHNCSDDKWPQDANNPKSKKVSKPCVHYTDSWWYGGEVYLSLNQMMSQNINNLAKLVENMAIVPNGMPTLDSGKVTGTTNVLVKMKILNSAGNAVQAEHLRFRKVTVNVGGSPDGKGVTLTLPTWANTVNELVLGAEFPSVKDSDNYTSALHDLKKSDEKAYDLYNYMLQYITDPGIQRPFQILAALQLKKVGVIQNNAMIQYLENIVAVLQQNGVTYNPNAAQSDGSNTAMQDTVPVKGVLDEIFGGLIGVGAYGVKNNEHGAQEASMNMNNIMQLIYSLGSTSSDGKNNDIARQQFNMVIKTQQIGLNVIDTIVNSIGLVYRHFKAEAIGTTAAEGSIAVAGGAAALAASAVPFVQTATVLAVAAQTSVQVLNMVQQVNMALQLMYMPLAILIFSLLFVVGLNFAVLVPLVPYILFWAGELAWLLGTIEAMIAAPIMMLGLTHPGGNDIIGHVVPGVKMLLGIVFRPVLMVLGLLVGIMLTYVVIKYSAQGFHIVAESIIPGVGSGKGAMNSGGSLVTSSDVQGTIACVMLIIFAHFIVLAFNKCFSAIYAVPEKVMQWIGGQAEKVGLEDLQQMTSTVQSTSQQIGQSGGQSMQAGGDAAKQLSGSGAQTGEKVSGNVTQQSDRAVEKQRNKPESNKPGGES